MTLVLCALFFSLLGATVVFSEVTRVKQVEYQLGQFSYQLPDTYHQIPDESKKTMHAYDQGTYGPILVEQVESFTHSLVFFPIENWLKQYHEGKLVIHRHAEVTEHIKLNTDVKDFEYETFILEIPDENPYIKNTKIHLILVIKPKVDATEFFMNNLIIQVSFDIRDMPTIRVADFLAEFVQNLKTLDHAQQTSSSQKTP